MSRLKEKNVFLQSSLCCLASFVLQIAPQRKHKHFPIRIAYHECFPSYANVKLAGKIVVTREKLFRLMADEMGILFHKTPFMDSGGRD